MFDNIIRTVKFNGRLISISKYLFLIHIDRYGSLKKMSLFIVEEILKEWISFVHYYRNYEHPSSTTPHWNFGLNAFVICPHEAILFLWESVASRCLPITCGCNWKISKEVNQNPNFMARVIAPPNVLRVLTINHQTNIKSNLSMYYFQPSTTRASGFCGPHSRRIVSQ